MQAEFAANYDVKYSKTSEEENDHTPKPQQQKAQQGITINLKDGLGKMQKRSREAIIRFPKHNMEKDSEKYYRAKLMLYSPWRQENNIMGESASYFDQYRNCLEDITENAQHYTQNGPSFEEAMQDLNEFGPPVHAFANVAPGVEQQNIEDEQEGNVEERHLEQQDLDENAELMMAKVDKGIGQRFDTQTDTNLMSSAEYCKKMRQLNKEQQNIVQYHRKWCKSVIRAARHNEPFPKAYKVFISGPGGVGKSHVIDLLKNDTYRLLRHLPSVHPHDVLSLVCAPTGTGATGTVSHIVILANTVVNILVEFDDPKIGVKAKRMSHYRQNYPNSVPISRHEASFNIGVRKCIHATRRQFPLRLSWASTIHKVQGLTTDSIVVSFEGRFFPGQAYVGLSRVRCLDGLHILKFDPAQIHVDCAVVREMERLRENHILDNTEAANPVPFNLQVSHLNIRGIKSHTNDLKLDQLVKQSNVLCFCETFLKGEDNFSQYSFGRDDMKIFRIDRPRANDQSGSDGVLLAVQLNIQPILVARQISHNLEYVAVHVNYNNDTLLIISLYRPPGSSVNMFLQEMEGILNDINPQSYACIIVGDFNEDICQSKSKILSYFTSRGFQQKIDAPTRDSGSLLDHTYVSPEVNVISSSVHDTYYSDHDFVSVKIL